MTLIISKLKGAPKRAMSAFLSYSKEKRSLLKKQYPHLKNTDISSILSKMWREAPNEEKIPHFEREKEDRKKYHEAMAQWKKVKEEENSLKIDSKDEKLENDQELIKMINTIDFLDLPASNFNVNYSDIEEPSTLDLSESFGEDHFFNSPIESESNEQIQSIDINSTNSNSKGKPLFDNSTHPLNHDLSFLRDSFLK